MMLSASSTTRLRSSEPPYDRGTGQLRRWDQFRTAGENSRALDWRRQIAAVDTRLASHTHRHVNCPLLPATSSDVNAPQEREGAP
jgi:hypothetical protein